MFQACAIRVVSRTMISRFSRKPEEITTGASAKAPSTATTAITVCCNFISCSLASEHALRAKRQHGDKQQEDAHLSQAVPEPQPTDRFHHAHDQASPQAP